MIPELRRQFNSNFTSGKYKSFLKHLEMKCGTSIHFRVSETPCFFPASLLNKMARYGEELVHQLLSNERYREASNASVPTEFSVPHEDQTPLFVSVDFGLVKNERGEIEPKLVELQAFPTLYAYQAVLAKQYVESFSLPSQLGFFLGGLDHKSYWELLRTAIVGQHDPNWRDSDRSNHNTRARIRRSFQPGSHAGLCETRFISMACGLALYPGPVHRRDSRDCSGASDVRACTAERGHHRTERTRAVAC